MNVSMTEAAEKFIRRMVRFGGAGDDAGFRLLVSPGGCSGLSAEFSVAATPETGDAVVMVNGVKLFLPAESRILLDGVTIDFTDTPMATGLKFIDPKQKSCACSSASPGIDLAAIDVATIGRKH